MCAVIVDNVWQVGSVDEGSLKSDEEYDDLAMQDMMHENDYCSGDDGEERKNLFPPIETSVKYSENLDRFLRSREELPLPERPLCSYPSLMVEKNERRVPPGNIKMRKRSSSIPTMKEQGSIIRDPILSFAPNS